MPKLPWFQFYPADWICDTQILSLQARGAWITLLAVMWQSKERGKLSLPLPQYARLFGSSEAEAQSVINELIMCGICDADETSNGLVTLLSRRMIREEKSRESTRYRVARSRESAKSETSNASVTPQKSEVRSQKSESESKEATTTTSARSRKKASAPSTKTNQPIWGNGRIRLDSEKRTWIGLDKKDFDMWQTAYPAVDVQLELTRAIAWCLSDPKRGRKSNYLKFLSGWFSRSQDRGGSRNGAKPSHGLRPVTDYSGRDKEMFEGETVKQIAERL